MVSNYPIVILKLLFFFFLLISDVFAGDVILQGQFTYPPPKIHPDQDVVIRLPHENDQITIASFHIQEFDKTKSDARDVIHLLAAILTRFDVVAIQGINDPTGIAIRRLEYVVDARLQDYGCIIGPRLGRTSVKQQYAFLFNTATMAVGEFYTFNDMSHDHFHREPFVAQFKTQKGNFDFVLINIHTEPDAATEEINALPIVLKEAQHRFPIEKDFIVLGDLNADCTYFTEDDGTSPLKSSDYQWLITNDMDTYLPVPSCTYDRIIVTAATAGEDFTGKSGVFRFERAFGLSMDKAREVSDHYPVFSVFYVNKDTDL